MARKTTRNVLIEDEVISVPLLRHSMNFSLQPEDCETPTGVSMTVPDHTMDMREIYERYVTGRPIEVTSGNDVYYMDDQGNPVEMPNMKALDLTEIAERLEAVRENRAMLEHQIEQEEELNNQLEAEKARKEKALEDERLLKLYEERRRANAD